LLSTNANRTKDGNTIGPVGWMFSWRLDSDFPIRFAAVAQPVNASRNSNLLDKREGEKAMLIWQIR
jgi:hypothetical protein